jgi:protein-S-isoprenylcysteine O-methyltransferase Ste14
VTESAEEQPRPGAGSPEPSTAPEEPPSTLRKIGSFFFAWRNLLFSGVVIVLMVLVRPVPLLGDPAADRWMDLAGFLTTLAGQLLRAAVIGFAYIRRGGKGGKVYAASLVTEGFFAHCRNPLYVGNILVLVGLALVHGSPWVLAILIPAACFGYSAIVATEEAYLHNRFGAEYEEYCRRVPRWMIRFRGMGESLRGMHFDWWRVVNKEYTSAITWVAGMLALFAYEAYTWGPAAARPGIRPRLIAAAAFMAVVWSVVRYVKKTERARLRRREEREALKTG